MKMILKQRAPVVFTAVVLLSIFCLNVFAGVPATINYQGRLKQNGLPVNGSVNMTFRITNLGGGTEYWNSDSVPVVVSSGLFNHVLGTAGDTSDLSQISWATIVPYIEVQIPTGNTLLPREQLNASAYSMYSSSSAYSFTAGTAAYLNPNTIADYENIKVGTATAVSSFSGNISASHVTNGVFASGLPYVFPTGATLTVVSSVTFQNGAFSVGSSNLVVTGGNVGIGSTSPAGWFQVGPGTFTVLNIGNVGIGSATPQQALDVDANLPDNNYGGIRVTNTNYSALGGPMIDFFNSPWTHSSARIYSNIGSGGTASSLNFQVANSVPVLQNRMIIDVNGNVGVGNTGPTGWFEVGPGTFTVLSTGLVGIGSSNPGVNLDIVGSNAQARISGTSNNDNPQYMIYHQRAGNDQIWAMAMQGSSPITGSANKDFTINDGSNNNYITLKNAGASQNILLSPNASGNVGIGTTNPTYSLDVQDTTADQNIQSTTGTNYAYTAWHNTGGQLFIGLESSVGGSLITGAAPYASVMGSESTTKPIQFGINNSVVMTMLNGGYVGIGTTNPASYLTIQGSALSATQGIRIIEADGSDDIDFINSGSSNKAYSMYQVGNDWRLWECNAGQGPGGTGNDRFVLKAGGNVGIGTTNPVNMLQVQGTGGGSAGIYLNNATPSATANTLYYNGTNLMWSGTALATGGGMTNPMTTTGDMIYGVGSTPTRLAGAAGFLKSTGAAAPTWSAITAANVGAGTFAGSFTFSSAITASAGVTGNVSGSAGSCTGNAATATSLTGGGAGTLPYQSGANTTAMLGAGTANYILRCGGAGAPSWSSALYDNGTNVGIGTTNPVRKFDLRGDSILYSANGSYSEGMSVFYTGASSSGGGYDLHIGAAGTAPSATTLKGYIRVRNGGNNNIIFGNYYSSTDHIYLEVNNTNNNINLCPSGGNVGIGTSAPTNSFEVSGGAFFWNNVSMPADVYFAKSTMYANGSTAILSNGDIDTTGYVGAGTSSPGYALTVIGSAWCTNGNWAGSDRRWKKDISPLTDSLNKIMNLQGVSFNWNVEKFPKMRFEKDRQLGLIAQDVEKVIPEVITTDRDGYKGLSYEKLVPVLIEAIKTQQKEIEDLFQEIKELKNK